MPTATKKKHKRVPSRRPATPKPKPEPAELNDRPRLTRREVEVAILVSEGKTYPEVAVALSLQYETVRSYVNALRDKTGRRRKSMLAMWAAGQRAWLNERLEHGKDKEV